jgi:acetyl-CoA carboxylase carboxyl transferase subunit beta
MKEWFRRQPKHFTPAPRENGQQIPDNMWVKCPSCGELNYVKQLNDNLKVCKCGYHMRLAAREWLSLLDADSFVEEDADLAPCDPLEFVSTKDVYAQKLTENQERVGLNDALISGRGTIAGHALQIAVSEFGFIGGSMGSVYGERLARAAEHAAAAGTPLLTITATGGAGPRHGGGWGWGMA